jgi:4a-hydroxytetrahydrobiopterin dehydratase
MTMALKDEICVPCREGSPTLKAEEISALLAELPDWKVVDGHHLHRRLTFADFASALAWLNLAGVLCEKQGHHGDFALGWGYVEINIHTHKTGGITRADAVLAAKLDAIYPSDLRAILK